MTSLPAEMLAKAAAFHQNHICLDGHLDVLLDIDPLQASQETGGQFDLAKARRGGMAGAVFAVHATADRPSEEAEVRLRSEHEARFGFLSEIAAHHPADAGLARNPDEVAALHDEGRFALIAELQNTAPLSENLERLDAWIDRGIAMVAFNFIGNNAWADSARPYPYASGSYAWDGISPLGREAVALLNNRGTLIDVSQSSSAALQAMANVTRAPLISSHAGARDIVDFERNLTNEDMRAIAATGGVTNVVGFAPYLLTADQALQDKLCDLWEHYGLARPTRLSDMMSINDPATADWPADKFWEFLHEFHVAVELEKPRATTTELVTTIDHVVEQIGIEHVGLASDFNHGGGLADWMDMGESMNVTAALMARGYDDDALAKIWGLNFLGAWRRALDAAR